MGRPSCVVTCSSTRDASATSSSDCRERAGNSFTGATMEKRATAAQAASGAQLGLSINHRSNSTSVKWRYRSGTVSPWQASPCHLASKSLKVPRRCCPCRGSQFSGLASSCSGCSASSQRRESRARPRNPSSTATSDSAHFRRACRSRIPGSRCMLSLGWFSTSSLCVLVAAWAYLHFGSWKPPCTGWQHVRVHY